MKAKGLTINYTANGIKRTATGSSADFSLITDERQGYKLVLTTKTPITIESIVATFDVTYPSGSSFFVNGFQSWTDTKEMFANEKQPNFPFFMVPTLKKQGNLFYGDYNICKHTIPYSHRKGVFHSFSYTYINDNNRSFKLFGSLNERDGYTVFGSDFSKNILKVSKDLEGVTLNGKYTIFDILILSGKKDKVIADYLSALELPKLTAPELRGYTSWYNYYQNISEQVITRDLASFDEYQGKLNLFQIDDGYQEAVGDYLLIDKTKFPNGLKPIVEAIHAKGLMAGLWLAPFIAEEKSTLLKEHPDWFRQENGKPKKIGSNWSGYYGLDLENEEVNAHLHHTFDVVLNEWGFDLVKLDFLCAGGNIPENGKSRATLMFEAIDLLRDCVKDKYILGCGCPMVPAFGKVEYMRIGSDMCEVWKDSPILKLLVKENPSTVKAVYNALYRQHLSGIAFYNDPDVFLMRDYQIKFSFEQQKLLKELLKLTGNVFLTSDDMSRYSSERKAIFEDFLAHSNKKILKIDRKSSIVSIDYMMDNKNYNITFDIKKGIRIK